MKSSKTTRTQTIKSEPQSSSNIPTGDPHPQSAKPQSHAAIGESTVKITCYTQRGRRCIVGERRRDESDAREKEGKYGNVKSDSGKHEIEADWVRFRSDLDQIRDLVNTLTADRVRYADRVSPVSIYINRYLRHYEARVIMEDLELGRRPRITTMPQTVHVLHRVIPAFTRINYNLGYERSALSSSKCGGGNIHEWLQIRWMRDMFGEVCRERDHSSCSTMSTSLSYPLHLPVVACKSILPYLSRYDHVLRGVLGNSGHWGSLLASRLMLHSLKDANT
ncbi:hypothetical protein Ccrd_011082 [Cynara cardunculus var. scolymus]|uniref:Uncharacterized protein n=1 Tax=Cynara cardunculus var. scolymus TaxID=59895 RepID=A0A103YK48_CYNCS|nr:hypothetical protein Ccrd_011082 [Cynara cardunculus var. scolymus]